MSTSTVFMLLFAAIAAASISFLFYFYKAKNPTNIVWFLAFLRFLGLFGILLLLINPVFTKNELLLQKPILSIAVDNSSSISFLKAGETAKKVSQILKNNSDLDKKFEIQTVQFEEELLSKTPYNFAGKKTNIANFAKDLKNNTNSAKAAVVLVTDGNQTSGNEYVFSFDANKKVFPVVLGDTTKVYDLKIKQLNTNKYAFLKNKFPVEVFVEQIGAKEANATISISNATGELARQKISFTANKKSVVTSFLLAADKVGNQVYTAKITSSVKEKNNFNNSKKFAVEVINQKTTIAIVSAINHPDIGALKRAIETNEQRKVVLVHPSKITSIENANVMVLYQPNSTFKQIFTTPNYNKVNKFIITGPHTDFGFLNQVQKELVFKMSQQTEDYLPEYNTSFNLYAIDNSSIFLNFPPLQNNYGIVTVSPKVTVLLHSKIRGLTSNNPMLAFAENGASRTAFLLGENCWKWRLQTYASQQKFDDFDNFAEKIIQYLSSNNSKKPLLVDYESFYNFGDNIEISAQFFNKNREFDENAQLSFILVNKKSKKRINYTMLKSTASFKVVLDDLAAGEYSFEVKELISGEHFAASFEILDFDIEKQFVNPDVTTLQQLAKQTNAAVYYPNQLEDLIKNLLNDDSYKTIQKESNTRISLIDWKWLLVMILLFFGLEWFVRKYHGLL